VHYVRERNIRVEIKSRHGGRANAGDISVHRTGTMRTMNGIVIIHIVTHV